MLGGRATIVAALALAVLGAGCLGATSGSDAVEPTGSDGDGQAGASPPASHQVNVIETHTQILLHGEAVTCAGAATSPRCGVLLFGPEGEPPSTSFIVTSDNATAVNVSAAWNASTPASEELKLTVTNRETGDTVQVAGASPLNATFDLEPGEYTSSIGADPEPAAGVAVYQEATYWVEGAVVER